MLRRISVAVLGDTSDEVLVTFDRDGAPYNELLRDDPDDHTAVDLARRYRLLRRDERQTSRQLGERRATAHQTQRAAIDAASAALDEAQRIYAAALEAANNEFQSVVDGLVDEQRAADDARAATRSEIDDDAYAAAEAIIAKRDADAAAADAAIDAVI